MEKTGFSKHAFTIRAVVCASMAWSHGVAAQGVGDFPTRPIRLIVHIGPGGGLDITARAVGQKLSERWGRPIIVDNRPGGNGSIAAELAAKAAPDGYTLCTLTASNTIDAAVDPGRRARLEKDLVGISQMSSSHYVFYVHPNVPVHTIRDLVAHAKAAQGKLNYGTSGVLHHLGWEMFNVMAGTRITHVPYKSAAAVVTASLGGEVQIAMNNLVTLRPYVTQNRIRMLAITASKRSAVAPELPTVAEAGFPGYEVNQWYGLVTAAKVPAGIVRELSTGIADALKSPDLSQRLAGDGSTPVGSNPDEFRAHIRNELAKWAKVMKEARITLN